MDITYDFAVIGGGVNEYGIDPTAFRRRRTEADRHLEPLDEVNRPGSLKG